METIQTSIENLLAVKLMGIPLSLLLLSFGILLATFVLRRLLTRRLVNFLVARIKVSDTDYDDKLVEGFRQPLSMAILILGVWLAIDILPLKSETLDIHRFVSMTGKIALLLLFMLVVVRAINIFTEYLKEKAADPRHWMDTSLVPLIALSMKTLAWILVLVIIIDEMGYSVSGIIASLGIGGIAVALAAKDTLANLFGSVTVMVDRPFRIGDWVKSADFEGTVEEIGFRTTKIRTFEKTVQVVPNDKIANMMIENMDRMKDRHLNVRRVKMNIGLEYRTKADRMERGVEAIREILHTHPMVDQRLILVYFTDFGDFSLNIFVYYFTASTKWDEHLSIRQDVNLKIMRKLEELGLAIAFPTQTIYLEKTGGKLPTDIP